MRTVRVAEAKNHLSRYLRIVQRGGRVRILHRDRPVADLVPVNEEQASRSMTDRELAEANIRDGIARPPSQTGPWPEDLLTPGFPDRKARARRVLVESRKKR